MEFRGRFPSAGQTAAPPGHNEEEKLRRKLSELAGNLSDKAPSSEEEEKKSCVGRGARAAPPAPPALDALKDPDLSSSSDEMPTEAQKVRQPIFFSNPEAGAWRFVLGLQRRHGDAEDTSPWRRCTRGPSVSTMRLQVERPGPCVSQHGSGSASPENFRPFEGENKIMKSKIFCFSQTVKVSGTNFEEA